ncbi:MAG: Fur family transcriptional regulator [Lentisphaerae bacterium]|nr:Fur family transcriptional regulator [Lentisphaerota bacterium]
MSAASQQHNRSLREQFARVVRDLKQELLPEDEAVIAAFLSAERHVTETELQALVGDAAIDTSQVRRTLRMLCDLGIAQAVRLDGQTTYEHLHLDHHHDHLICVRCGRIVEFLDEDIETRQRDTCLAHGFTPLMHRLEIRGVCQDCARALPVTRALSSCLRGEVVEIGDVVGGHGLRQRLLALGLTRGATVTLIGNDGPVVLDVRGSRLALGRGEAARIIVRQPQSSEHGKAKHGQEPG